MKRIIMLTAFIVSSFSMFSQGVLGSDIYIKNSAGTRGYVYRIGNHLGVNDSTANTFLSGIKSLDSSILAKLNSTIAVTQSGTWNINNISGSITLPTGAATSANQVVEQSFLSNIETSTNNISYWADNYTLPNPVETGATPVSNGWQTYGLVSTLSPSLTNGRTAMSSITDKGGTRVTLIDMSGNYVAAGGGGGGSSTTVLYDSTGSATSMTVTNLNSLASSNVNGWQSDKVSNLTSKAIDYKIFVKLTMSNTAPANEKSVYVYVCPFYYDGTNWFAASQGTTTLPTGTQGTTTIASPNNLRLLGALNYTTQNMVLQDNFLLSTAFGDRMPDGFSIIVINYTGSAVSASSNVISYKPINSKNQ